MMTYSRPDDAYFTAGFIAVCDKVDGSDLFVAQVYHEWFMVENPDRKSE